MPGTSSSCSTDAKPPWAARHSTIRPASVGPDAVERVQILGRCGGQADRPGRRAGTGRARPGRRGPGRDPGRHHHLLAVLQGGGQVETGHVRLAGRARRRAGSPRSPARPARWDRRPAPSPRRPRGPSRPARRPGARRRPRVARGRGGLPSPAPAARPDAPGHQGEREGDDHVGPSRAAQPWQQAIHAGHARRGATHRPAPTRAYLTTRFTSRPGTTTSRTTLLPSRAEATLGRSRAAATTSASAVPDGHLDAVAQLAVDLHHDRDGLALEEGRVGLGPRLAPQGLAAQGLPELAGDVGREREEQRHGGLGRVAQRRGGPLARRRGPRRRPWWPG